MSEICIVAAIRLPDGRIFRGQRHSDCLRIARDLVDYLADYRGDPPWEPEYGSDQGFITSANRYVGREEGLALQLAAGLESACHSGYRAHLLFSEDLY